MAEILVHAGMAKTGSTSVQRWLAQHRDQLAENGIQLLVAATAPDSSGDLRLEPYRTGNLNSGRIVLAWSAAGFAPGIPERFVAELARAASRDDRVLVTAEALSLLFSRLDDPFLDALDALAREHTVRVAYYVRPQHSALETLWRQGGFRRPAPPSTEIVDQSRALRYLHTTLGVEARAPHVDFVVRPFRSDLLRGGGAVSDFATTFLGVDARGADIQENTGLPLELVNRLRLAPDGTFWNGAAERYPRAALRAAAARVDLPASPATKRSRQILRAYCRATFEADNRELIRRLGWPTSEFVPPAKLDGKWDVSELDDLWTPRDSPAELQQLFDTLLAALAAG